MKNDYAVIMAGGKGERFWPLSTSRRPKQLLSLVGGKPLVAMAVERIKGMIPANRILVITTSDLVNETRKVVRSLPKDNIIGEPFGRDTAAAVALASAVVRKRSPDGVFCVLTADHVISDIAVFQETLRSGLEKASREDVLITIGIVPASASTGFGYIEAGGNVSSDEKTEFFRASKFIEKPDRKVAERYLKSGKHFWNSGIFIWSVDSIQKALRVHRPQLYEMARRIEPLVGSARFAKALANEYLRLDKISIDYAIMEKSKNILMAKGKFAWDDVGTWAALENHFKNDRTGNIAIGRLETVDSAGNIVVSDGGRLTALVGLNDLIVVNSPGATLICAKSRAQDVKRMVNLLRAKRTYNDIL